MNKKYSIKSFLKDPEFISWVNHPDQEISTFWELFAERNPGCKDDMLKAAEIIRALKVKNEYPDHEIRQDMLNNIVGKIGGSSIYHSPKSSAPRGLFKVLLKSAAIFQILAIFSFSFYLLLPSIKNDNNLNPGNDAIFSREAPIGAKLETLLPDGSSVWLNSGGIIDYYHDKYSNTRIVQLQGEAFFEVVENPEVPFIVKAKGISVRALGTSFNIRAFEEKESSEVALLTGKVLVTTSGGDDQLELLPGEKAVIKGLDSQLTKQRFNYLQEIGWKDGILVFEKADFNSIKEKLERWYGVTIYVSDQSEFEDWEVDSQFDNTSLELVLENLSFTKEFNYKINGNEIYLMQNKL